MSAPTTTARQTPLGIKLDDGFSTRIAFAVDPDISFWEKTVTPPGLDGGEAIDTSTMFNETLRTFAPRALTTMTPMTVTAAYDPAAFDQIQSILNVEGAITCHFPDGSTLDFWGYLRTFTPQSNEEGTQPTAQIEIQPTNQDPATGSEEPYVLTSVPGT